ncbi:MAG TPA: P-loop NTPase fold protein [Kribbellaceae bacterium]|nr:P-loop NTPase fold protein [Kribbellaceae bacterium]
MSSGRDRAASSSNDLVYPTDRAAGHPLLLVVDDLDRCRPAEVVEILESIQTLPRDPPSGRSGRPAPVAVVVAADAVWLHAAFESECSVGSAIVDPGQSIGHLFCDKILQLVVPVPNLGMREQSGYLAALLGRQTKSARP